MRRGFTLLMLFLSACEGEQPSLEALRVAGYQDLQRGDLEAALARAEEGRRRALEQREPVWEWAFEVLAAEVMTSQRRNAEAVALLERGLAASTPPDMLRARALMTRGLARCRSAERPEDLQFAEVDLADAGRIVTGLPSADLAGEVALRRGTCRFQQRDWPGAEALFREALGAARGLKLPFLETNATGSLGLVLTRMGRYDEATEWLRQSLDVASLVGADTSRAKTTVNLGWCYYMLGDYERALPILTRAEALTSARGLKGDQLVALINIGNTHQQLGDGTSAVANYRRALAIAEELGDKTVAAQLLANMGAVALEQGQYAEAESRVLAALQLEDQLKDTAGRQDSLLTLGQIWAGRGDLIKAQSLYREVITSPDTGPDLLWAARVALARLLVASGRRTDAEAEFRKAFTLMEDSRARLRAAENRISFFSSLRRFHDDYVEFLVDSGRAEEALEVADRSRARMLREHLERGTQPGPVRAADLRRLARRLDAVLLAYWLGPRRSFLWVVTPDRVDLRILPERAAIEREVTDYQARVLRSRDPLGEGGPDAARLYSLLLAPATLPSGARVIVALDGALHQLNLETLVVPGERPHYWIEDVTLAVAPALGLLEQPAATSPAAGRGLLLIGDPQPPSEEFPPLPHAAREVRSIAALFDPAQRSVFTGPDAEPGAYARAHPERFAFVHFAAHAKANRESPLDSAIVLSVRDDAYKLYARDIAALPIKAELVSLSACHGAGARAYAGEGLVGLAWAFLDSGARNVIGGLWNVEDASTADVMEQLYEGLRSGVEPAAALRQAKLELLRSGTAYRKPFYWAPFVVYTRGAGAR